MKETLYDRVHNRSLYSTPDVTLERAKEFTHLMVPNLTYSKAQKNFEERREVARYRTIVDYFWENAKFRLKDSETNQKYLDDINNKLVEIRRINKALKKACSNLIRKIYHTKKGIGII